MSILRTVNIAIFHLVNIVCNEIGGELGSCDTLCIGLSEWRLMFSWVLNCPCFFGEAFLFLPRKGKLIDDVLMNRQYAANWKLCFHFWIFLLILFKLKLWSDFITAKPTYWCSLSQPGASYLCRVHCRSVKVHCSTVRVQHGSVYSSSEGCSVAQ